LLSLEVFVKLGEKRTMAENQFGEHHGQKRHADDELEANHNISTQFKKLRISSRPFQTSYEAADQVFRSFLPPRACKWV
jgi:allophanate hydrolase subunit 2